MYSCILTTAPWPRRIKTFLDLIVNLVLSGAGQMHYLLLKLIHLSSKVVCIGSWCLPGVTFLSQSGQFHPHVTTLHLCCVKMSGEGQHLLSKWCQRFLEHKTTMSAHLHGEKKGKFIKYCPICHFLGQQRGVRHLFYPWSAFLNGKKKNQKHDLIDS